MVGQPHKKVKLYQLKRPKILPKKRSLDQKIIQNRTFGVYVLVTEFLIDSFKPTKRSKKKKKFKITQYGSMSKL